MSFPIRVLLVEDDAETAERLRSACTEAVEGEVGVTLAGDPAQALARLGESEFDLAVLDHAKGMEVFRALHQDHPGVPVVLLTESTDLEPVNELLAAARQADLFGVDTERAMIAFYTEERIEACIEEIAALLRGIAELAALPVDASPPLELSTSETRAIQLFARRAGGSAASVSGLGGGLSGAKTVVVDAADASGLRIAHVVGKLSAVGTIPSAVEGYENAIPYLPAGLGAPLAGVVGAGAGDVGAVFFRLADDYRRTWFDCLADGPRDAASSAERLHARFEDRHREAPVERLTVGELRRRVASDEEFERWGAVIPDDTEPTEALEVEAARGIQHRDLHGLNVLVSDSNEPLLIDYDNYASANAALDPVTLELSAIFHRDERAQAARGGWPTPEQARRWYELDAYLEGCPYPDAIRACRAWAEDGACSPGELAATLYAVALRQLMFENTDKALARALIEAGASGLE